ncbi:hypothetical protein HDV05_005965, partial [Chytridiales sp. JEL 0842]
MEMCKHDMSGEYFFDRNSSCFNAILDIYRTGVIVCPPTVSQETFYAELDFWQIQYSRSDSEPADPVSKLSTSDRKLLELTLCLMLTAQKNNISKVTLVVDLDGSVRWLEFMRRSKREDQWGDLFGSMVSASFEDASLRLEAFVDALNYKVSGLGVENAIVVKPITAELKCRNQASTAEPNDQEAAAAVAKEESIVSFITGWNCVLTIP